MMDITSTMTSHLPPSNNQYGYCDSYFLETDDSIYMTRAKAREQARVMAQQRQKAIAVELSRTTSDEYQSEILDHMCVMERETLPDVRSIDIQTEIQWYMRPYLLDFIIEAHAAFQLLPETLYLTINILDRYCSKRVVYKKHYQLVGCAALLIASKYGDKKDRVPTIRELKSMCCSLYEEEMFTQMEWHVLVTLNWMIGYPTVDAFLEIAMSDCPEDLELKHMAWYICEIALYHRDYVSVLPSIIARSALAMARCVLMRSIPTSTDWSNTYDYEVVNGLSHKLYSPSQILSQKYASSHLSRVSASLEVVLQRHAEVSQQSSPPVDTEMEAADKQSAPAVSTAEPHTPQKGQYPANMPYGYLTPPITPDSDPNAIANQNKHSQNYPPVYPATPTPPSSTERMPYQQAQSYPYDQVQPVGQQYYVQ